MYLCSCDGNPDDSSASPAKNRQNQKNKIIMKKVTIDDIVKEEGQAWEDIAPNNSDKIYIDNDGYGIVRRKSDDACLLEDGNEVYYYSSYSSGNSYWFDGD